VIAPAYRIVRHAERGSIVLGLIEEQERAGRRPLSAVSLGGVEAFSDACVFGSFERAAQARGLNESSVRKPVDRLETWLGLSLFERRPRLRLLPDGASFSPSAEMILMALSEARTADREPHLGRKPVSALTLGSIEAFWDAHLYGSFQKAAKARGLDPESVKGPTETLELWLGAELFDRQPRLILNVRGLSFLPVAGTILYLMHRARSQLSFASLIEHSGSQGVETVIKRMHKSDDHPGVYLID
jgi:DNA-binding transcriptional LysR family regulator